MVCCLAILVHLESATPMFMHDGPNPTRGWIMVIRGMLWCDMVVLALVWLNEALSFVHLIYLGGF